MFRHDDLEALIKEHPRSALRMLAAVSQRLSNAERRLNSLTSRDVESRVADYLLHLPGTWQDGAVTVTLPLAKRDVASYLTPPRELQPGTQEPRQAGSDCDSRGTFSVDHPTRSAAATGRRNLKPWPGVATPTVE